MAFSLGINVILNVFKCSKGKVALIGGRYKIPVRKSKLQGLICVYKTDITSWKAQTISHPYTDTQNVNVIDCLFSNVKLWSLFSK